MTTSQLRQTCSNPKHQSASHSSDPVVVLYCINSVIRACYLFIYLCIYLFMYHYPHHYLFQLLLFLFLFVSLLWDKWNAGRREGKQSSTGKQQAEDAAQFPCVFIMRFIFIITNSLQFTNYKREQPAYTFSDYITNI